MPGPPSSAIKEDFPIDVLASGEVFCEKITVEKIAKECDRCEDEKIEGWVNLKTSSDQKSSCIYLPVSFVFREKQT